MSDEQRGDLDPGDREMTSADLTAHDAAHGQVADGASGGPQGDLGPESDEDAASGGARTDPAL